MTVLQPKKPSASARGVPSIMRPSHRPMGKATAIMRKPLSAEAAPAISGNGATVPLWLTGWCTPWASRNSACGTNTAHQPYHGRPQPSQARPAISRPAAKVTQPAANTARRMPQCSSRRRQATVPAMYTSEPAAISAP